MRRRTGVGGAEAVEHRDLGALLGDDERVREAGEAVALRPVQHHDRLARRRRRAGTLTNAPPARKASCSTVNASGDASEHAPSATRRRRRRRWRGRRPARPWPRASGSSAWCTTRPLRTTTSPERSPASAAIGPAAGRGLVARLAELLGGHRAGTGRGRGRRSGCSARSPRPAVGHATSASCSAAATRRSTSQSGPGECARRCQE